MLYPQNGGRIVAIDTVTSLHSNSAINRTNSTVGPKCHRITFYFRSRSIHFVPFSPNLCCCAAGQFCSVSFIVYLSIFKLILLFFVFTSKLTDFILLTTLHLLTVCSIYSPLEQLRYFFGSILENRNSVSAGRSTSDAGRDVRSSAATVAPRSGPMTSGSAVA